MIRCYTVVFTCTKSKDNYRHLYEVGVILLVVAPWEKEMQVPTKSTQFTFVLCHREFDDSIRSCECCKSVRITIKL